MKKQICVRMCEICCVRSTRRVERGKENKGVSLRRIECLIWLCAKRTRMGLRAEERENKGEMKICNNWESGRGRIFP